MITLYYGSGSPYAWRVQLALEHKALPYERKVLSFAAGDTRKPEFVALNPRHRVPVIVDGDFVLYESNAIVEYLDDAYPRPRAAAVPRRRTQSRARAPPRSLKSTATSTRPPTRSSTRRSPRSPRSAMSQKLEGGARHVARGDCAIHAATMRGDYLAGPLSAADFALYPLVAFLDRCAIKLPDFDPQGVMTPEFAAWKARIEALPYFDKTYPPHWKK